MRNLTRKLQIYEKAQFTFLFMFGIYLLAAGVK